MLLKTGNFVIKFQQDNLGELKLNRLAVHMPSGLKFVIL